MTKQELVSSGCRKARRGSPGKRVKIDFGGATGHDHARRRGATRSREEDGDADTTIKVGWDDWQQMAAGPARRHDRVHDGQAQGRGRHVERDAAAGRAREAERLSLA